MTYHTIPYHTGVSIISEKWFFYKGSYERLEFFIKGPYVGFSKNKVVFYKKKEIVLRKKCAFSWNSLIFEVARVVFGWSHYSRVAPTAFYMGLYVVVRSIFWHFGFWVCKDCQNWVFYKRGLVFYKISLKWEFFLMRFLLK